MDPGIGSTVIHFDVYGCNERIVGSPQELHSKIRQLIEKAGFTIRAQTLDVWDSLLVGSCTSFFVLAESHVRVETWPERNMHANGEIQICNYSRDNRAHARQLARNIITELNAEKGEVFVLERGPDHPLRAQASGQQTLARFLQLPFEPPH